MGQTEQLVQLMASEAMLNVTSCRKEKVALSQEAMPADMPSQSQEPRVSYTAPPLQSVWLMKSS